MKNGENGVDKLEQSLKESYRHVEPPALDAQWRQDVMREVRQISSASRKETGLLELLFPIDTLSRFAQASGTAAVCALVVLLLQGGLSIDVMELLAGDPSGLLSFALLTL